MNYSKDSRKKMNESTNETAQKSQKNKKKAKVWVLRTIFIVLIISVFAAVGAGLGVLVGILRGAPDISTLELKPTENYTSFVYDQNGAEVDRLSGGENRIYVTLDQIPQHFQDAVIAIEDERYYEHNGIDLRGIFRALLVNIQTMDTTEGASTITQQLIKNNVFKTNDKTWTRKIQEMYLAIQFDAIYEKDLILEYYLNTFLLGHGEYGVQAAANFYFNKDASELTLAESAVLAGITKYPTAYSPILNPDRNKERAHLILNKMEEQGKITAEQKAEALNEDPYASIAIRQQEIAEEGAHSYFVDAVIEEVVQDLQDKNNMTETQANNLIYGGGIQIYTTLDQMMQDVVDQYMADDSMFPTKVSYVINYAASIEKPDGTVSHRGGQGTLSSDDEATLEQFKKDKLAEWGATDQDKIYGEVLQIVPQAQAAFVIMDHNNGHIKALSGGRGEKYGDRVFNRATQALRQPGSLFKVLAAYAPALDMDILSPGSIIVDEAYKIGKYAPNNWYNGYRGPATVRTGIYNSMNILAVKALEMVGLNSSFDYLKNFGFTTLSETNDKFYPLALGGISRGVSPLELTAAYAAIANQGTYIEPILYTQILDRDGNVILDNSSPATHTVIKASTASMLTDMMEDTLKRGTAGTLNRTFTTMPISGKTGTTNDDKDFLFSGYTPYYTATVWMGYDQPQTLNIGSPQRHQLLWGSIMRDIHNNLELPSKQFSKVTTGYTTETVCMTSGLLPSDLCSKVSTDYFSVGQVPTDYCDMHVTMMICSVSGKVASEFCPHDLVESRVIVTDGADSEDELALHELCDVHTIDTLIPEVPEVPEIPDLPEVPDTPGSTDTPSTGNPNAPNWPTWPSWPSWPSSNGTIPVPNPGNSSSTPSTSTPTPTPDPEPEPEEEEELEDYLEDTIEPPITLPEDDSFYIPQG